VPNGIDVELYINGDKQDLEEMIPANPTTESRTSRRKRRNGPL
jgi:hypothetical protein